MRHSLLLALALCGVAHASAAPRIDLSATPAWSGWTRPGRATEIELRVGTDTATRATVEIVAGRQAVQADLDLQPGRVVRLHIPVRSAAQIVVSAAGAAGPAQRREIDIAEAESPLLGVGLVTADRVELEGFHTVALAADELPRNASAYASVDALILDAPTLAALDPAQLGALLAHAAACGRIAVVDPAAHAQRVLEGAGGCRGQALLHAVSVADVRHRLQASLATRLPPAMPPGGLGEPARPGHAVWQRVAVLLAVSLAASALALVFFTALPVILLTPALAAGVALALLHAMQPPSQLVVWSEGESGARVARYQAWQQFPGVVRERVRVAMPPQLASSAQPCEPAQAMRLHFDPERRHATSAEFETRLFSQTSICYAGSFPMARAIAVGTLAGGRREVRNEGTAAWPPGTLLVDGGAHDLPPLAPGASTSIGTRTGSQRQHGVVRTAMTRTPTDGAAALWALELGGVAELPGGSMGWLLVSVAPR